MKKIYDSLIVGGGPAGLSAAIYLARFNRSVLIIDKHDGRASYAQKNENYLGFPSGIKARELSARGRKQAEKYGAKIVVDEIISIQKKQKIFVCKGDKQEYSGKTLILAMGVTDLFPHIGDWKRFVGRSLFWCITCDGYKTKGKKIVVIGQDDDAACTALQFLNFTENITFVTNIHTGKETISKVWLKRFKEMGIIYYPQNIIRLHSRDVINHVSTKRKHGYIKNIVLEDGTSIDVDMVFNQQGSIPNYELADDIGVQLNEHKCICVNSQQRTNIPLVYSAGDITSLHAHQIASAVHEGSMAAQSANYDLYEDYQKS